LKGIARHDDGWTERDALPKITRQGLPSAFSVELVGKYSAFEEIDLADYLAVRDRAVRLIAAEDAYAALLIAMHTYNLLTAHADRTTIAPKDLPLLDDFLERQREFQQGLHEQLRADAGLAEEQKTENAIRDHFRLLQATDNLSLLTCVDFAKPANLLHPLPLRDGRHAEIQVKWRGPRKFQLTPWPFAEREMRWQFPARHVEGKAFAAAEELQEQYARAPIEMLSVTVTAEGS
jgi:hypothetical protein